MKENRIRFTISKDGQVKMEVMNGEGESCLLTTQEIQQRLVMNGMNQTGAGEKPEFYSTSSVETMGDLFNS